MQAAIGSFTCHVIENNGEENEIEEENDRHWKEEGKVEAVLWHPTSEETTKFRALISGRKDFQNITRWCWEVVF